MRRTLLLAAFAVAAAMLVASVLRHRSDPHAFGQPPTAGAAAGPDQEGVPCYFPGRAGLDLVEEPRLRARGGTPLDRLRAALTELHRGPAGAAALPVFAPGTAPRGLYLTPEGVAYLDEPAAAWDRPAGLREEVLILRSIARTVLRQVPEVHALVFLTDGAPRNTLLTHCMVQGRYVLPRLRRPRKARDAEPDAEPEAGDAPAPGAARTQ